MSVSALVKFLSVLKITIVFEKKKIVSWNMCSFSSPEPKAQERLFLLVPSFVL